MNRSLRLHPQAQRDLMEIALYTARTWGVDQAEAYAVRIDAKLVDLARCPSSGTARDDLSPGLRKASIGAHNIYYLFDDTTLDVIRILHPAMDVGAALIDP